MNNAMLDDTIFVPEEPKQQSVLMTRKMSEILSYLREVYREKGYIPSLRDISEHFCFRSSSAAKFHIDKLVSSGYLNKTQSGRAFVPGPLFGGETDFHSDADDDGMSDGNGRYKRFVVENSDAVAFGVLPGDVIFYEPKEDVSLGDYCVITCGGNTFIRKLAIRKAHVWFDAGDSRIDPIDGLNSEVLGVVVRLVRTMK